MRNVIRKCANMQLQVYASIRKTVEKSMHERTQPSTRAMPGAPWVRGWDDKVEVKSYSKPDAARRKEAGGRAQGTHTGIPPVGNQ